MENLTKLEIKKAGKELAQELGIKKEVVIFEKNLNSENAIQKTKDCDLTSFYIGDETHFAGKPQAITETKVRLSLAHKIKKPKIDPKYYFINSPPDGRELRAHGKKTLTQEFFLYKVVSNEREYIVLSLEKLDLVDQNFEGMLLQSSSSTEITKRFSLKGFTNLFFVANTKPTISIMSLDDLLDVTKNISKPDFLKYIFYHNEDERVYEQPEDYSKLVACVLLSGKNEGYPLHLLTIGGAGLGKTKKEESLNFKFGEHKGIYEASNSRLKGLIPSFKEKPASRGYILECNRIALIDELFKMIEASINDGHASSSAVGNLLNQFNPLLEHKKRTIGSGNDNALFINPTAKIITDCNPFSTKHTLPEHLNVLDISTLSRFLVWIVDREHWQFIQNQKEYTSGALCSGEPPITLKYNVFLSVYDTLNSFTSKIDDSEVRKIFKGVSSQLFDERLLPLWEARGIHHTYLIIDGLTKLRCLFEDRTQDFEANSRDYEETEKLLLRIIKNMQNPIARSFR